MKTILLLMAVTLVAAADTVPSGARIDVRTMEPISSKTSDGRIFNGTVDQDVVDTAGKVVIPKGAPAELMVRRVSKDLVLDLESVNVAGKRYSVAANEIDRTGKAGVGANSRTGKFVGGGAIFGTLLGAIAGGGKGAAIGAASGAAAGAGAQMLTKGRAVRVPSESVLTFRLERELVVRDAVYRKRNGHTYRQ